MQIAQADVVVAFESSWSDWITGGLPSNGIPATPRTTKTAAVVYGTGGGLDAKTLLRHMLRARLLGYSYAYFTDGVLPDPYRQLPGYFGDELAALQAVQQL